LSSVEQMAGTEKSAPPRRIGRDASQLMSSLTSQYSAQQKTPPERGLYVAIETD